MIFSRVFDILYIFRNIRYIFNDISWSVVTPCSASSTLFGMIRVFSWPTDAKTSSRGRES